jgi:hypothetical protein
MEVITQETSPLLWITLSLLFQTQVSVSSLVSVYGQLLDFSKLRIILPRVKFLQLDLLSSLTLLLSIQWMLHNFGASCLDLLCSCLELTPRLQWLRPQLLLFVILGWGRRIQEVSLPSSYALLDSLFPFHSVLIGASSSSM